MGANRALVAKSPVQLTVARYRTLLRDNTTTGHCVRNQHIVRDNGAVIVIDGGAGYGQVIAKEAMGYRHRAGQEARRCSRRCAR
jgi:LDH2 family malate/lactate/ureidoglycolate dehydrogenase